MKKIFNHLNGMWHCTKCGRAFLECDYWYVFKFEMHDHRHVLENDITFDNASTELMGVQEKYFFIISSDPNAIHELRVRVLCHPFLFTLCVKTNIFNGVDHLNFFLINSKEITYSFACSILLQEIEKCLLLQLFGVFES